jgi:hypothetical protein
MKRWGGRSVPKATFNFTEIEPDSICTVSTHTPTGGHFFCTFHLIANPQISKHLVEWNRVAGQLLYLMRVVLEIRLAYEGSDLKRERATRLQLSEMPGWSS